MCVCLYERVIESKNMLIIRNQEVIEDAAWVAWKCVFNNTAGSVGSSEMDWKNTTEQPTKMPCSVKGANKQ